MLPASSCQWVLCWGRQARAPVCRLSRATSARRVLHRASPGTRFAGQLRKGPGLKAWGRDCASKGRAAAVRAGAAAQWTRRARRTNARACTMQRRCRSMLPSIEQTAAPLSQRPRRRGPAHPSAGYAEPTRECSTFVSTTRHPKLRAEPEAVQHSSSGRTRLSVTISSVELTFWWPCFGRTDHPVRSTFLTACLNQRRGCRRVGTCEHVGMCVIQLAFGRAGQRANKQGVTTMGCAKQVPLLQCQGWNTSALALLPLPNPLRSKLLSFV